MLQDTHTLLQENAYPLPIRFQSVEFLDGLSPHKRNHLFRAYFYPHLLLSGHVQYEYVLSVLLLRYQSSHHDRLGNRIEKFGTLLDYQGRNSFYGRILYLEKSYSSTQELHASRILTHVYLRQEEPLDIPSRSRLYLYLVPHRNALVMERTFLNQFLIQRGTLNQ